MLISGEKERFFGMLRDKSFDKKIFVRFPNSLILIGKYNRAAETICSVFIHNDVNNYSEPFLDFWLYNSEKLICERLTTLDGLMPMTDDGAYFKSCQQPECGTECVEITDGEFTWTGLGCSKCQKIRHGLSNMSHEFYTRNEHEAFNISETKIFCPLWIEDFMENTK